MDDDLISHCNDFLANKGVTLWGENFNVIFPDDRAKAARWLARQYEDLRSYLQDVSLSPSRLGSPESDREEN